jgi:lysophospholipase L1-like esterase
MPISRRTLLRAGASGGLLAALVACGDSGVRAAGSNRNAAAAAGSPTASRDSLPAGSAVPVKPTKFAMVGDSITKASSPALTNVLTTQGFTEIAIEAQVSRRIGTGDGKGAPLSGVKTLYSMIAKGAKPDVWAIAMGTNDVGKYPDAAAYGALIDQMMTMPSAKVPMLWVDVYNPNELQGTKVFNLVLRDRARARGNTKVLSWFDLASDPKSKILRQDHIHPNDTGTLVFAELVAKALA